MGQQQQQQQHGPTQQPAQLLAPQQLFSTAAGEAALRRLYAATLAALPFPFEERWVQTASFGRAHVVVCGPPAGHPLLLWHGSTAPAPYMLCTPSLRPLVDRFRVYCPDLPCHGKLLLLVRNAAAAGGATNAFCGECRGSQSWMETARGSCMGRRGCCCADGGPLIRCPTTAAGSSSDPAVLDPSTHAHGRWCLEVMQALRLMPEQTSSTGNSNPGASGGSGGTGDTRARTNSGGGGGSIREQGPKRRQRPPLHLGVSLGGTMLLELGCVVAPEAVGGAALVVPGGLLPGGWGGAGWQGGGSRLGWVHLPVVRASPVCT